MIDVSDPTNPTLLGVYNTASISDVEVVGNFAYIAIIETRADEHDLGFQIIDVRNPTEPVLVESYGEGYNGLHVRGDIVYLAGGQNALDILRINGIESQSPEDSEHSADSQNNEYVPSESDDRLRRALPGQWVAVRGPSGNIPNDEPIAEPSQQELLAFLQDELRSSQIRILERDMGKSLEEFTQQELIEGATQFFTTNSNLDFTFYSDGTMDIFDAQVVKLLDTSFNITERPLVGGYFVESVVGTHFVDEGRLQIVVKNEDDVWETLNVQVSIDGDHMTWTLHHMGETAEMVLERVGAAQ